MPHEAFRLRNEGESALKNSLNPGEIPDEVSGTTQGKVRFLDYLAILMKWKNFIIINCVLVVLIAVLIAFTLPKWYRATASVLPPKDQGMLNMLAAPSSLLRGLSSVQRLGGMGGNTGAYNYIAILKSRSAMEAVVKKFDLLAVYEIADSSMEKAVGQLVANTAFDFQDEDYITIDVYDRSPERAAAMANYFVDVLNNLSLRLGTQEARSSREFIEQRIEDTQDSLHAAEEALKTYQERSGMMMITPEQTSGISAIADIYGMKAKKEIEVGILERTVAPDNDALRQAKLELREIEKKLATIPEAGLETFRLYRTVAAQQKILEVLLPLYEQAKINEQKDMPVLLVLDRAVPPERKVKPQRLLIMLSAGFLAFFLMIALAFLMEGLAQRTRTTTTLEERLRRFVMRISSLYRTRAEL